MAICTKCGVCISDADMMAGTHSCAEGAVPQPSLLAKAKGFLEGWF